MATMMVASAVVTFRVTVLIFLCLSLWCRSISRTSGNHFLPAPSTVKDLVGVVNRAG